MAVTVLLSEPSPPSGVIQDTGAYAQTKATVQWTAAADYAHVADLLAGGSVADIAKGTSTYEFDGLSTATCTNVTVQANFTCEDAPTTGNDYNILSDDTVIELCTG